MEFLPLSELDFGFNDAVQYKHKRNKDMFSRMFVRTSNLEDVMHHNSYFIIGEKGYGKTALSVHISNNSLNNTYANTVYLGATDYTDFINLKNKGMWILSDYKTAWKVTLLYLVAQLISSRQTSLQKIFSSSQYKTIKKMISEYEQYSRSPEVSQAIKLMQTYSQNMEAEENAGLAKAKANAARSSSSEVNDTILKDKLRDLQRQFEDAIRNLRVGSNFVIFIDGIDVRPTEIEHAEYTECIRGLGNAAWELNSEFFSNLKGSLGTIRVVLLTRVDILRQMQLHNISSKIDDNSVIISWYTPMNRISDSAIFSFAIRLLSWNQGDKEFTNKEIWRHYFGTDDLQQTFAKVLRLTLYRPRDIVKIFNLLKKYSKNNNEKILNVKYLDNPAFLREYSEYMLSEIRDQISFYYNEDDYKILLRFFDNFGGKSKFKHSEFTVAYEKLISELSRKNTPLPKFAESEEIFLQYLYDLSILGYVEYSNTNVRFFRWSHIERSPADLSPQVKTKTDYMIHSGLIKSLNLGMELKEIESVRNEQAQVISVAAHANSPSRRNITAADNTNPSRTRRKRRRRKNSTTQ